MVDGVGVRARGGALVLMLGGWGGVQARIAQQGASSNDEINVSKQTTTRL